MSCRWKAVDEEGVDIAGQKGNQTETEKTNRHPGMWDYTRASEFRYP